MSTQSILDPYDDVKTDAVDYKYFPEPNITPIALSDEFVNDAIATCPELYDAKEARYIKAGLTATDADIILADKGMSAYFEEGMGKAKNAKKEKRVSPA